MIDLPTQTAQQKVIAAIHDWEHASTAARLILKIGDEDYSDLIPEGSLKQDGIAITLEATFVGAVPLRLYGAPVTLSVAIDGVEVPQLSGLISLQEPNDDRASTKLDAASAGALADKYHLNESIEYSGAPPYFVVQDALRRLPYPERGEIRVDNVQGPPLYFARGSEPGPFKPNQKVSDILSSVASVVPYIYRDNARGGTRAFVSAGLATIPDIPDHMHFRAEELIFWKSPALEMQQYAAVIADKVDQAGDSIFGDDPPTATVVYRGQDFPPLAGLTMRVEWNGTAADAWQYVYTKALELERGLYKSVPILPYNPLLETADAFTVTEHKEEEPGAGFYEREWLHYTDSWEKPWSSGFSTKPTCSATLANEQFVKSPTLVLAAISQGNNKPLWGEDAISLYFDESVPWVSTDEEGYLVFDVESSNGVLADDTGELIIQ